VHTLKRFIDCYIETETCNLRCHYCYITQKRRFNNKLVKFKHTPQEIRKALSKERLGGTCLFNLCAGGETLLVAEILDVVMELLAEGHYVMIVTNGVLTKRFEEFVKFDPSLLKKLFFKFSFHYLELLRLGKIEAFFQNVNKMKEVGASFTVEITPSDELIPYIQDVKDICMEKLGALCHVTIARDDRTKGIDILSEHSFDEYMKIWGGFESELFDFKTTIFYKKRKEFCYAGDWSLYLNLNTGKLTQCYGRREIDNIYRNIDEPLKIQAVGHNCNLPHCYNGHAFLTLGTIPELETPSYANVRDRVNTSGEHWLQPAMRNIMNQKLKDNNQTYSVYQKQVVGLKEIFHKAGSVQKRISRSLKRKPNE
jgi:organic radical activating enzyme